MCALAPLVRNAAHPAPLLAQQLRHGPLFGRNYATLQEHLTRRFPVFPKQHVRLEWKDLSDWETATNIRRLANTTPELRRELGRTMASLALGLDLLRMVDRDVMELYAEQARNAWAELHLLLANLGPATAAGLAGVLATVAAIEDYRPEQGDALPTPLRDPALPRRLYAFAAALDGGNVSQRGPTLFGSYLEIYAESENASRSAVGEGIHVPGWQGTQPRIATVADVWVYARNQLRLHRAFQDIVWASQDDLGRAEQGTKKNLCAAELEIGISNVCAALEELRIAGPELTPGSTRDPEETLARLVSWLAKQVRDEDRPPGRSAYQFRDRAGVFEIRFGDESAFVPRKGNDGAAYVREIMQKDGIQLDARELYCNIHGLTGLSEEEAQKVTDGAACGTGESPESRRRESEAERQRLERDLRKLHARILKARQREDTAEEERLLNEMKKCCECIRDRGGEVKMNEEDGTPNIVGRFRSVHQAKTKRPDSAIAMAVKDFVRKCALSRFDDGFGMPKFAEHVKKHIKARRYTPPDPKPHWEF